MTLEKIRSSRPFFPTEDIDSILLDIKTALQQGQLRNGKNLKLYEEIFADYIGAPNAVAFDSDQSALETALHYFGVEGREVIVCTNSFISIPNSVATAGGKVVFADICDNTLSMDPESLKKIITDKTLGVILTHIAGFPNPNTSEIIEICRRNNLFLIEDATHAVGAIFKGKKIGTFGDAAVFASTPTKPITTGEGGMLVTKNNDLAKEARLFSYYGSGPGKTNFVKLGRHMMLPEISAILGVYQIKRIEEFIAWRNEVASVYNQAIDKSKVFGRVACAENSRSSYYKYPLILPDGIDRRQFSQRLEQLGIETGSVFYPPCHMQTVYGSEKFSSNGNLLKAERVLPRTITLPMHVALSVENARFVMDACMSAIGVAN